MSDDATTNDDDTSTDTPGTASGPEPTEGDPAPPAAPPDCGWPRTSKLGSKGQKVEDLQTLLAARQMYAGAVDSDYGPLTQQAVQQLQRAFRRMSLRHGPIDGLFDEDTRKYACLAFPL